MELLDHGVRTDAFRPRPLALLGIPVVLPSRGDPRLRLALVIVSLQVLGQVGLGFKLSIAQILASIVVCALVEIAITYRRQHQLIWPASAILTGNGVAFILRAVGTRPGDWWSLNGVEFFVLASLVGILSKHVIRLGDQHVFNPSNLGLVLCLLVAGAPRVFPQYLWWGPLNLQVGLALAVILAGAVWVLRPLRMLPLVASFGATFGLLVGALAMAGRCFDAVWHTGPVCGSDYWVAITLSPELGVFVFFMISDPKTTPRLAVVRIAFGAVLALVAAGLLMVQPTEFGIKVALLASLTILSPLGLLGDRVMAGGFGWLSQVRLLSRPALVLCFVAVVMLAVPPAVSALASNPQVLAVDRVVVPSDGGPSPPKQ
jgi:hypothetical protein